VTGSTAKKHDHCFDAYAVLEKLDPGTALFSKEPELLLSKWSVISNQNLIEAMYYPPLGSTLSPIFIFEIPCVSTSCFYTAMPRHWIFKLPHFLNQSYTFQFTRMRDTIVTFWPSWNVYEEIHCPLSRRNQYLRVLSVWNKHFFLARPDCRSIGRKNLVIRPLQFQLLLCGSNGLWIHYSSPPLHRMKDFSRISP